MTKGARYCSQDDEGTWWYQPPSQASRSRCRVDRCPVCDEQFVRTQMHRGPACSIRCGKKLGGYSKKSCERCGQEFQPISANHRYCCDDCKRGSAICNQCGSEFVVGKKAAGLFCSTECFYEWKVPTGSVAEFGGGYLIVKVPKDIPGTRVSHGGTQDRWMLQHRYVMQKKLGRVLERHEHVHHLNGDKADNRPENLELWKKSHPHGVRAADYHCAGCRCFD